MTKTKFTCAKCGEAKEIRTAGGVGYSETEDGQRFCYDCCAVLDREYMVETGNSKALPLYLSKRTVKTTWGEPSYGL